MKPSQTIINKDEGTVTMSISHYNKLVLYKELALELRDALKGDGAK